MTSKQLSVLRYICGYIAAHGTIPSYQSMADDLGYVGKSNVYRMCDKLIEHGYLRRRYWMLNHTSIEVLRPVPVPRAPDGAALFAVAL